VAAKDGRAGLLEVPMTSVSQKPVLAAAIVSLFFTGYVPYVMRLTKIGQRLARELCREIEKEEQFRSGFDSIRESMRSILHGVGDSQSTQ